MEARVRRLARRQVGAAGDQGRVRRARGDGHRSEGGWLYYIASPDNPAQRYLFRTRLDGKGKPERITPAREAGHPRLRRRAQLPLRHRDLLEPRQPADHPAGPAARATRSIRTLVDNAGAARAGDGAPARRRSSGSRSQAEDGAPMPGVLMKPADFDSTRKYPLLFFVYGGPGNTEVDDMWGGYWLWHTMLTQKGYLVAIVDNRGTPAPLGREWRKAIYGQLGVLETGDQAAAARTLLQRAVRGLRAAVGIWGWSYGGFMTPQRAVPASRRSTGPASRSRRDPLGALRQRLHRAVQRADHRQPRGLRPRARRSAT